MPEEKITAMIPIKAYDDDQYLFMATEQGLVKKTLLREYVNVRKKGLAAITLRDDDQLIEVKITDNEKDILLVTKYGQCIRFDVNDVRATGRTSMGVRGINLDDRDKVIGMQVNTQGDCLLVVSEKGMGKRTAMGEFTNQNRGGKGVKCYKITEKTGNVIGMKAVNEDDEIMMINSEGDGSMTAQGNLAATAKETGDITMTGGSGAVGSAAVLSLIHIFKGLNDTSLVNVAGGLSMTHSNGAVGIGVAVNDFAVHNIAGIRCV